MKILAYEHISACMPGHALAAEGELMLLAMVRDLASIPGIETVVLVHPQFEAAMPEKVTRLECDGPIWPAFRRAVHEAQAVWILAPEQEGILERLTAVALQGGRVLLGCRPAALRVCASKRATAQVLDAARIPIVPVSDSPWALAGIEAIVAKPDDGAGCQDTFIFYDRASLERSPLSNRKDFVFQPLVSGEPLSLSALFCEGRGRLLCCNRQHVAARADRFEFEGVTVNARLDHDGRYADLVDRIAGAIPDLHGYAGIDFIQSERGPLVLEINPRLTTSYAGLRRALDINAARLVLELPESLDDSFAPIVRPGKPERIEVVHAV
jgi:predicted ATP-grasp superfamily ATP-dependent carboligase